MLKQNLLAAMSGPVSRRQEPARSSGCSSDQSSAGGGVGRGRQGGFRMRTQGGGAGRRSQEDGWSGLQLGRLAGRWRKIGGSVLERRDKRGLCPMAGVPLPCSLLSHPSPGHLSDPPRGTSAFLSFPFLHPHQEGPSNGHSHACPQRRTPRWLFADPEVPARNRASGGWGRVAAGD